MFQLPAWTGCLSILSVFKEQLHHSWLLLPPPELPTQLSEVIALRAIPALSVPLETPQNNDKGLICIYLG